MELKLELVQVQVPVQEHAQAHVLMREQAREQVSALETMAAPLRRASACLGHPPPEAQHSRDDQTLRHRPDQRPRSRT